MISPIFTTVVIGFLSIMIYMKVTTNRFNTGDEKRLERERESNSIRRKSLDELEYISIPFDSLPFSAPAPENTEDGEGSPAPVPENDAIKKDEESILALKDKKIVNFTGVSNTDLKLTYGAPNLPLLTEYDQNYTALVKSLDSWGAHLLGAGRREEARKILEFAVECRTDLKSSYMALADMYVEGFEFDKLDHLTEVAGSINSLMSAPIVRALKEKGDINKYVEAKK
ncbi:MAG: hypothetical protein K6E63_12085 [Lachnospiraceae bacterium]|nr:hypothetical protein [Lachnospiraceae bacterium]